MRLKLNELRSLIAEAIRKAYDILDVNSSVTPEELKKAYRAKAIQLHPDRNVGTDTTTAMQNLNYAYSLLSDPVKKSKYDLSGDKTLGDLGVDYGRASTTSSSAPKSSNSSGYTSPRSGSAEYDDWLRREKQAHHDAESQNQKYRAQREQDREDKRRAQRRAQYRNPAKEWHDRVETRYFGRLWKDSSGLPVYLIHSIKLTPSEFKVVEETCNIWKMSHEFVLPPKGQTQDFSFRTDLKGDELVIEMLSYYDDMIATWGYDGCAEGTYWRVIWNEAIELEKNQTPPTPRTNKEKKSSETPRNSSKETYKIYGKKGTAPVHTRFKGKVYGGAKDTKFKVNDKANVRLDGSTLKVTNPETGHTQDWQAESVKNMSNNELINELTRFLSHN